MATRAGPSLCSVFLIYLRMQMWQLHGESVPGEKGTHILGHIGECAAKMGWHLAWNPYTCVPIFMKKTLAMHALFKIFWGSMCVVLFQNRKKWVPIFGKITPRHGYSFEQLAAHPRPIQIWVTPPPKSGLQSLPLNLLQGNMHPFQPNSSPWFIPP